MPGKWVQFQVILNITTLHYTLIITILKVFKHFVFEQVHIESQSTTTVASMDSEEEYNMKVCHIIANN